MSSKYDELDALLRDSASSDDRTVIVTADKSRRVVVAGVNWERTPEGLAKLAARGIKLTTKRETASGGTERSTVERFGAVASNVVGMLTGERVEKKEEAPTPTPESAPTPNGRTRGARVTA